MEREHHGALFSRERGTRGSGLVMNIAFLFLGLILLVGCATPNSTSTPLPSMPQTSAGPTTDPAQARDQIDAYLTELAENDDFAGVVLVRETGKSF